MAATIDVRAFLPTKVRAVVDISSVRFPDTNVDVDSVWKTFTFSDEHVKFLASPNIDTAMASKDGIAYLFYYDGRFSIKGPGLLHDTVATILEENTRAPILTEVIWDDISGEESPKYKPSSVTKEHAIIRHGTEQPLYKILGIKADTDVPGESVELLMGYGSFLAIYSYDPALNSEGRLMLDRVGQISRHTPAYFITNASTRSLFFRERLS